MICLKSICHVCGCTEDDACEEGCSWVDRARTLCSACAPLSDEERVEKREANASDLHMRLEQITDEALVLKYRLRLLEQPLPAKKPRRTKAQHPNYPKGVK